jgi:hypothetical protein
MNTFNSPRWFYYWRMYQHTYLVLVSFCSSTLLSLDPICLACVENRLRPCRAPVDLPCLACTKKCHHVALAASPASMPLPNRPCPHHYCFGFALSLAFALVPCLVLDGARKLYVKTKIHLINNNLLLKWAWRILTFITTLSSLRRERERERELVSTIQHH